MVAFPDLFRNQPQSEPAFSGPDSSVETPAEVRDSAIAATPLPTLLGNVIATAQPVLDFINREKELDIEDAKVAQVTGQPIATGNDKQVPVTSNIGLNPNAIQVNKPIFIAGIAALVGLGALVLLKRK